eukprot:TRINITY_DN3092_c0_g1_i3.p1 TRINITY_DN3092_c0_g1~~TRINITY_DN3092_c0_g1_i3.p1  ORF type:complete len:622 (-),score=172.32 TRINITY_DN3092_c0_g1_i3:49-1914(-)
MGISGLLPLLEGITRQADVAEFAGKRVAVDAYCWLHRACFTCALELCQNQPTSKYVQWCVHMVQMLLSKGVKPVLVFDGAPLPAKTSQEVKRREKREHNLEQARRKFQAGNIQEANSYFQKAVDVTPTMAHVLIMALRQLGVECVVAPYEADAQLAYLARTHYVEAVITEDSDMIPYFCPCVLFKMDKTGTGHLVRIDDLPKTCFGSATLKIMRQMCILSGCDYLPSIPGMGIKTSLKLFLQYLNADKVLHHLRINFGERLSPDYEKQFHYAELTFEHQRVYDPVQRLTLPLTPTPPDMPTDDADWVAANAGAALAAELAQAIACGDVDPVTRQQFADDASRAQLLALRPALSRARSGRGSFAVGESPLRPRPRGRTAVAPAVQRTGGIWKYFAVGSLGTQPAAATVPADPGSDANDGAADETGAPPTCDASVADSSDDVDDDAGYALPTQPRLIVRSKFFADVVSPPAAADDRCGAAESPNDGNANTSTDTVDSSSDSADSAPKECSEAQRQQQKQQEQPEQEQTEAVEADSEPAYQSQFTTTKRITLPHPQQAAAAAATSFLDHFLYSPTVPALRGSNSQPLPADCAAEHESSGVAQSQPPTKRVVAAKSSPPCKRRRV